MNRALPLEDPDAELFRQVGAGDGAAFERLLDRYQRPLFNFLYRFVGAREEAEDLAQDTFLRVYRAAPTYAPRATFRAFLYQVAAHLAINAQRRKRVVRWCSLEWLQSSPDGRVNEFPDPNAIQPEAAVDRQELTKQLLAALQRLPPLQRIAFLLAYTQDCPTADIAQVLKKSVSAVEALLFRARTTLRATLAPSLPSAANRSQHPDSLSD
ncbi:MAG: RNA polymerase sigma factor [Elusimicrobia bacterium]|nr:RNA polymerase sigma factor [Elusimicrobiota bacterium]